MIAPLALLVASIGGIRMAHGYGKAQVRSFCEAELRAPGTVVGLDDKWTTVASRANLTCRVHDLEPVNWWSVLVYSGDELVGHLEVTRPTPSAPFRLRP